MESMEEMEGRDGRKDGMVEIEEVEINPSTNQEEEGEVEGSPEATSTVPGTPTCPQQIQHPAWP